MARQSRRPQSAPRPKARYRGGRGSISQGDLSGYSPAGAIAAARKLAPKTAKEEDK